jgi:hypothetical protein
MGWRGWFVRGPETAPARICFSYYYMGIINYYSPALRVGLAS